MGVGKVREDAPVTGPWLERVRKMSDDLTALQSRAGTEATVHLADSRQAEELLEPSSIDAVITSPPYPNEKDYTRTTRLESVLLDFERPDIAAAAERRGVPAPSNVGDVVYSARYRRTLPESIQATATEGHEWIIRGAGRGRYRFGRNDPSIRRPRPSVPSVNAAGGCLQSSGRRPCPQDWQIFPKKTLLRGLLGKDCEMFRGNRRWRIA